MFQKIDIPAAQGPYGANKLMLIMHGRGDVKESFIPFTHELNVTGLTYQLLDAPEAFLFGYSWYAAPPIDPIPDLKKNSARLLEFIATLDYAPQDIFIAGFSQGGAMAIETALAAQTTFAGVIALSPRIFIRPELLERASQYQGDVFIAHGKYDDVILFQETNERQQQLKAQGLKIDFHRFDMAHEIDIMEVLKLREWLNERL